MTRLGDTIPLDKHWSSLLIFWPIESNLTVLQLCDSLKNYFPVIHRAQPNYIYVPNSTPNDPLYSKYQYSLFSNSTYPNSDINVDKAWDLETGKNYVRVGVYDFPIFWGHEDFGNGTFAGSKIKGGWDFNLGKHISQVPHPPSSYIDNNGYTITDGKTNHGTSVAGIIGALRNNDKGIAGIAGGDVNKSNNGVDLYSFGIFDYHANTDDVFVCSVIVQGSIQNSTNGYGLHIQNHSWGGPSASGELKSSLNTAALNQCVVVCSRGNDGNTTPNYPASFNDEFVICVGASGTDGQYKNTSNGDYWWASSYGNDLDVIAPGTTQIIESTIDASIPPFSGLFCSPVSTNYQCFNGTSAAAPHVSGVSALLYSRHNTNAGFGNNLAPEDVEQLLQRYATDVGATGYDQYSGWGRVNALGSINVIKDVRYRVNHFQGNSSTTINKTVSNQMILADNPTMFGIASGYYFADRYTITHTFTNTFSSTTQILGVWPRLAATNGLSAATSQNGDRFESITYSISGNSVTVTTTTYAWFVNTDISGRPQNFWLTIQPSSMLTGYSVHTFDPAVNGINDQLLKNKIACNVYPNPAKDKLSIVTENDKILSVEIYDLIGNLILSEDVGKNLSSTNVSLNQLKTGIFVCKVTTAKGVSTSKFIKE